jgi:hypothetical protein
MQGIKLGRELRNRYQDYADVTGQSFDAVLQHALDDWMSVIGEGEIELITGCAIDTDAVRMGVPVVPCIVPTVAVH